jgi:hypothetical protein
MEIRSSSRFKGTNDFWLVAYQGGEEGWEVGATACKSAYCKDTYAISKSFFEVNAAWDILASSLA